MRGAFVLTCTAACWTASKPAPVAPTAPSNVVTVDTASVGFAGPSSRPRNRFPLHSVWEGTYVCSQGLSSVTMTLDAQRSGLLRARYDFGPVPSNTSVPTGAYSMTGGIHATEGGFTAELEPEEWIEHPGGYVMVSLSLVAEGREMTGTIHHTSCSDFVTRRIE